jgi:undecaprenyl-diphosphatase
MTESLEMLDRELLLRINSFHHPFLDFFMWHASDSWHTYLLVFVAAFFFFRKIPGKVLAFLLGCAIVAATTDLSANAMKHGMKRYRPTHNTELSSKVRTLRDYKGGTYGFISGHAANSFGLAMFIFLCMRWVAKKWRYLFFIYPLIVVYSRMYLGVHYPSDILFGMIDGLLFGWMGYLVMNAYFLKLDAQSSTDPVV